MSAFDAAGDQLLEGRKKTESTQQQGDTGIYGEIPDIVTYRNSLHKDAVSFQSGTYSPNWILLNFLMCKNKNLR